MGYTIHYEIKKANSTKFKQSVKLFKELMKKFPETVEYGKEQIKLILCGGMGEGEPVIDNTEIWFNGTQEGGWDHETFYLENNGKPFRGFTKTNRKPYDFAVCICCMCFAHFFGDDFEADGGDPICKVFKYNGYESPSQWVQAIEFWEKECEFEMPLKEKLTGFNDGLEIIK